MDISELYLKIQSQLDQQLPLVVYKKPGGNEVDCFLQNDNYLYEVSSYDSSGFVFAPFSNSEKTVIIPDTKSSFFTSIIPLTPKNLNYISKNASNASVEGKERKAHISLVNSGIQAIENSTFRKVVLSRKEEVPFSKSNVLEVFQRLVDLYANAFVYFWYHPKIGMWLGATPETLLRIDGDNFSTMSLAGTQPYTGSMEVSWGAKEIEEQAMVTEFVLKELAHNVNTIRRSESYTYKAGTLLHLKTDIAGTLKSNPQSIKNIIEVLHPTPAVCGLPKEEARSFILDNEGYDRKYYTGFLGELNRFNNGTSSSSLFVNLRCMEICKDKALLYVGGGITKDSIPEKEWEETVKKTETMKRVL